MRTRVNDALRAACMEQFATDSNNDYSKLVEAAIAAMRDPPQAVVEAGAIGIMNERLAQRGIPPLANLDMLNPDVLLEVIADAKAAWEAMIAGLLK